MAPLIVSEFITLDGVVEAPGGESSHPHTGWTTSYFSDEQGQFKFDEVMEAESLLIGRNTYDGFSAAWPNYEGPFADKMNSMPKYVISSTLTDPLAWNNSTVLSGDVVEEVKALKERDTGPIVVAGSATLVRTLIDEGLVDELRLMVFPVVIGGGLRPFSDERTKSTFELVETTRFDSGVVNYTYRPVENDDADVDFDEQTSALRSRKEG